MELQDNLKKLFEKEIDDVIEIEKSRLAEKAEELKSSLAEINEKLKKENLAEKAVKGIEELSSDGLPYVQKNWNKIFPEKVACLHYLRGAKKMIYPICPSNMQKDKIFNLKLNLAKKGILDQGGTYAIKVYDNSFSVSGSNPGYRFIDLKTEEGFSLPRFLCSSITSKYISLQGKYSSYLEEKEVECFNNFNFVKNISFGFNPMNGDIFIPGVDRSSIQALRNVERNLEYQDSFEKIKMEPDKIYIFEGEFPGKTRVYDRSCIFYIKKYDDNSICVFSASSNRSFHSDFSNLDKEVIKKMSIPFSSSDKRKLSIQTRINKKEYNKTNCKLSVFEEKDIPLVVEKIKRTYADFFVFGESKEVVKNMEMILS